jgi:LysR family transcriptional regulator, cell division regulator
MELTDLLTFAAVAKCGGVTRAANELGTVQSNVTSRIRNLENRIGKPLFDRHSRGMTITAAGRRLLPYAERLTVLSEEAINAARDEGEPKGPLAIGSMETTAAVRLPPLLARFHRKCSKVQVSLRTAPTEILVKAVLDRSLDGAFVAGPIDHPGLKVQPVFKEELVIVTARKWSSLSALRAATHQSGPSVLVFRTGCSYRQRLEAVLSKLGWPIAARLEFGTLDGILGCVAADVGLTLLPRAVVKQSGVAGALRIHPLQTPERNVQTLFVFRHEGHESSALTGFLDCL